MPRPILLLTLIVVLTSTPLRLAEAANDQARTLSEVGEGAGIEEVDGGVGDDSGESIKVDPSHVSVSTIGEFLPQPFGLALAIRGFPARLAAHPPPGLRAYSVRRHVLLQCFLC